MHWKEPGRLWQAAWAPHSETFPHSSTSAGQRGKVRPTQTAHGGSLTPPPWPRQPAPQTHPCSPQRPWLRTRTDSWPHTGRTQGSSHSACPHRAGPRTSGTRPCLEGGRGGRGDSAGHLIREAPRLLLRGLLRGPNTGVEASARAPVSSHRRAAGEGSPQRSAAAPPVSPGAAQPQHSPTQSPLGPTW